MQNDIVIFKNEEFGQVRTLCLNNVIWFVGKDVAEILGYNNTNKAIQMHVDEEDKKTLDYKGFSQFGNTLWSGSDFSNKTIINESGLYSLILSSKLPNVKKFKHWVTSEVLPSIRKNGGYIAGQGNMTPEQIVANALIVANNIIEAKNKQLEEMKPKVLFADAVMASENSILIRELAKLLKQNGVDIGEKRLYKQLRADGYICKHSTEPTQRAMELGLFERIVRTVQRTNNDLPLETITTKVTTKGQLYFINKYLGK